MSNALFSKEEALTGFTARRARALFFLIESQTAHRVAQATQATEILPSETVARDRDWAFFEAFTQSREPPLRPTIQDLERYAAQWAFLVPDNPLLRATIAHFLGEKYEFTEQAVPGILSALGLEAADVQAASRRLYGESPKAIFRARLGLIARLRWRWAALTGGLEALPHFWFVGARLPVDWSSSCATTKKKGIRFFRLWREAKRHPRKSDWSIPTRKSGQRMERSLFPLRGTRHACRSRSNFL